MASGADGLHRRRVLGPCSPSFHHTGSRDVVGLCNHALTSSLAVFLMLVSPRSSKLCFGLLGMVAAKCEELDSMPIGKGGSYQVRYAP